MDLAIVITVVVVALAFDYTNGFHDAANAIATSVSTRALTPRIALVLAAVMNFVGALLGQGVAHTVSDTIDTSGVSANHGLVIVLGGLLGAIIWNLITWYFGLPSSSSHALIGGLMGSALAAGATVHWSIIIDKVVIPMVASPLVGFVLAFLVMLAFMWIFRRRNPHRVFRGFRLMQTLSAAALALGHGLQDAQKTMGVMFLAVTLVYGFRVWPMRPTAVVIGAILVVTGVIFYSHYRAGRIDAPELSEVPLMPMLLLAMVWHARRRVEAQRQVEEMAEERRRRLEREREFLRDTSHAIRTPVTIARGHVELIQGTLNDPLAYDDSDVVLRQPRIGLLQDGVGDRAGFLDHRALRRQQGLLDPPPHRGLGRAQLTGGRRQAAGVDHGQKGALALPVGRGGEIKAHIFLIS